MLAGLTFGDRSALEQEHLAEAKANKEREKKRKKHKKEKSKKHKKSKSKKQQEQGHSSSGSDSSDRGFQDEWLKQHQQQQQQAGSSDGSPKAAATGSGAAELQREDWMTVPMARSEMFNQEQPNQEKPAEPEEAAVVGGIRYRNAEQEAAATERAAARETAGAAGGGGCARGPISAAAGVSWRIKAVQRAQQLAKEQGRDVNKVLSERWGSAAEIAKGLIDGAAAAAADDGQSGSNKHPSSSGNRPTGGAAAHYLSGVRSEQTAMRRPTGLGSGSRLSWRRPGQAEGTRDRDRDRDRNRDRSPDRDRDKSREWSRERDRSRDRFSARDGDRGDRHSRGSPESDRRDRSPSDRQQQHGRRQGQGSGSALGMHERERSRERDRGGNRYDREQQQQRQKQQQDRRGEPPSRRQQQQHQQQCDVVEALKAVAGHINTYSDDGSFLQQFSKQQRQQQEKQGEDQARGHQPHDSSPDDDMQHQQQEAAQLQPQADPLPTAAAASGSNRSTAELLRARLAGKSAAAAAGGADTGAADAAGNKSVAEALRARLSGKTLTAGTGVAAAGSCKTEVVQLPLIDVSGRAMPGAFGRESAAVARQQQELAAGGRVGKRVQRYGADGQRERYFADDDSVDLQTLVKRAKHGDDARDLDRTMASNIASRSRFKETDLDADAEYDYDAGLDLSESRRKRGDVQQQRQRERQRQISQFTRAQRLEERCTYCFSSAVRPKELAIAVGQSTYLSLVQRGRLVEGHCCIVPAEHVASTRQVDDNTWTEVRNFQKCLIRMFMEAGKEVLFLETATGLGAHRNHAIMECIPVHQEVFAKAPMYFKKALQEAESEWSQHASKAVINTKAKGLRGSIPPNFPYMYIQFGYANGFVHVIDDESKFDKDLGRQVMIGLLKLPAEVMHRRQRAEAPQVQADMAAAFRKQFGPFDWTKALD